MTHRAHVVGRTLTIAFLVALTSKAFGDPLTPSPDPAPPKPLTSYLHLRTPAHVLTDGGADLRLPPGYYLDEPTWGKLDTEVRRLQDSETRLNAENKSLKTSLSGWQPGWWTLAGAVAGGLAIGWYAHGKF